MEGAMPPRAKSLYSHFSLHTMLFKNGCR